jgi:16S rRNA (guanine966-N2)-methyltransferase
VRVVGGRLKGRPIEAPTGAATRPTSDRVREAMFNILSHSIDGWSIEGRRVLDLFAGSGALGIEAVSRGAALCVFVEDDADARGAIRANVEALGLGGVTKIFRRDATALGPAGKHDDFDLVFLDPPYDKGLAERALSSADAGGWLAAGALVVIEERAGTALALPPQYVEIDRRRWGDTQVSFLRWTGARPGSETIDG